MDPELQKILLTALGALVGVIITAFVTRSNKTLEVRMDAQQKQYDQLQEDLNAERVQRQADIERIHELLRINQALSHINHVQDDYVGELRQHIIDEKPPPPPPWPSALRESN